MATTMSKIEFACFLGRVLALNGKDGLQVAVRLDELPTRKGFITYRVKHYTYVPEERATRAGERLGIEKEHHVTVFGDRKKYIVRIRL